MGFIKLPSNSEKILLELVRAENPTQTLRSYYEGISIQARDELDGIIRELKEYGYIKVKWADNMPWQVVLNNSARTYSENLAEYESQELTHVQKETKVKNVIFISHRSTDAYIADMLVEFFVGTGIPKEFIFCSSLPGNDINERISGEVKGNLKNSSINIAILSHDYYQSAYCLNEIGVFWYEDVPVIPIALPEINPENMYGFFNNEYKLRRLNCDVDISYIYDTVREAVSEPNAKASIVTHENNKLREKYSEYLKKRENTQMNCISPLTFSFSEITTDDERIVLYYILQNNIRKVSRADITAWLNKSEIYGVNLDNAFDLLASLDGGIVNDNVLEFGIELFRKFSVSAASMLPELKKCVDQHTMFAVDTFKSIWNSEIIGHITGLFIAYIVDEKIRTFGVRSKINENIKGIEQWERNNMLSDTLSKNYEHCLDFFVRNNLVYASEWTSFGNVRQYALCHSLQKFLFNCPSEIVEELHKIKVTHCCDLSFN